jgi:hypothetical protein
MAALPEHGPATILSIAPRTPIRVLFACMALLIVLGLAGQISRFYLGHDFLYGLLPKFDFDTENTVPAWFSTICLFLCALTLSAIAHAERARKGMGAYWFWLAALFVVLSLDEAASFHELLYPLLRKRFHPTGFFYYGWVIPGAIFAIAVFIACCRFLRRLPAPSCRRFVVAGAIFCSGSLGMEMVGGRYYSLHGVDFTYAWMSILEESLEMTGEILLLRALLAYLAAHVKSVTISLQPDSSAAG